MDLIVSDMDHKDQEFRGWDMGNKKGVRFFTDHYLRVIRARKERNLPTLYDVLGPDSGKLEDHPMMGKKFTYDKSVHVVIGVYRQWHMGWYTMALTLVDGTRSSAQHILEAHGCQSDIYVEAARKFSLKAIF